MCLTTTSHRQRALFRVLHAFALLCPECGYCQGMGPIACTLLGYFEPSQAYAALVRLHDGHRFGLHSVFAPGFPGLGVLFGLQERLTAYLMPDVAEILVRFAFSSSSTIAERYRTDEAKYRTVDVRDKMVHHPLCQRRPFRRATSHLGRLSTRWPRRSRPRRRRHRMGLQRCVRFVTLQRPAR